MTFSEKLRMLIYEHELTQKELAKTLQIPVSTLGGYVQGTSEPDFETLKMFVRYFHVSADYLLDLPEDQTRYSSENDLLRIFRALSSEQQELYLEQGKAFIRINAKKGETSSILPSKTQNRVG